MDETLNDTTTDLVQNAKILIGMPNYMNLLSAEAHSNHLDCSVSWTKRDIDFNWAIIGRTFVHFARSQVCQAAVDGGYTHVFWVDDDALIPWEILPRFINHDVDVVLAPYPMRKPPYAIGVLASSTGDYHDHRSYVNYSTADLDKGMKEIDGGGTHCMLVKLETLLKHGPRTEDKEATKAAYPAPLLDLMKDLTEAQKAVLDEFVGDLPDESMSLAEEDGNGKPYFMMPKSGTEDMYFCYRLKKKGIKIWCDTDVFSSHVGFAPTITRGHTELCEERLDNGQVADHGIPVLYVPPESGPVDPTHAQEVPEMRQPAVDPRRASSLA